MFLAKKKLQLVQKKLFKKNFISNLNFWKNSYITFFQNFGFIYISKLFEIT